jgi:hypothetical protein
LHTGDRPSAHAAKHERHPEWFAEWRECLEGVFVLMDVVGWNEADSPHDIEISLAEHGETLSAALDSFKGVVEDDLREVDANDARRAEEGVAPRKEQVVRRSAAYIEFVELVEVRARRSA